MDPGLTLVASVILVFIAAGTGGWIISMFNSLIQVKNNIGKAWHNIDVLLLQRNEELPKLFDILKGYMKHEQEVLQSLTTLRTGYRNARSTTAKTNIENQIGERIGRLAFAGEQYPELKANELYQKTMERISVLESSIADRRVFFNETVNIYNIQIEQFPQIILAGMMRFRQHPYLKLPEKRQKEAVQC